MGEEKRVVMNYASLLPEKKKADARREKPMETLSPGGNGVRDRMRVGRGRSAGKGKTCGRGQKGQKSRSGYSRRPGFEGGQMPLHRRLPKRGFINIFKKEYQLINIGNLKNVEQTEGLDPEAMARAGMISDAKKLVKVLGGGELNKAFKITADAFSESARKKIEAAGGSCTIREKKKEEKGA